MEDHGLDVIENNHEPYLKRVVIDSFISKVLGEDHVALSEIKYIVSHMLR